jgi:hypothetical protein
VLVISQPAQMGSGKETVAGIKAAGTFISHGRVGHHAWSREKALSPLSAEF